MVSNVVQCLLEMMKHAHFMYSTELESMVGVCFRAFDGANYEARFAVAKLLGNLVAATQQSSIPPTTGKLSSDKQNMRSVLSYLKPRFFWNIVIFSSS